MTTYVALLRGIMPTNPNMKGEKLKGAFESLGFTNVRTVIASGNVVFETAASDDAALEKKIEDGLEKLLGFRRAAIVRSRQELEKLDRKNPFKGVRDEKPNYLLVTFFKDRKAELCSVITLTEGKTPDFMAKLEKKHGKELTSRTWKTVRRILAKMEPHK
jgi:uncharacterized protein (DUF1697 family)